MQVSGGSRAHRTMIGALWVLVIAALPGSGFAASIYHTCNGGSALCSTDTISGANTVLGNFGFGATFGNAFDLDGTLYATTGSNSLAVVNPATGVATVLGPLAADAYAIDFDSQGRLFMLGWNGWLYQVNKANGSGVAIGYTGVSSVMDISFDSQDRLFATGNGALYQINTSSGAVTSAIGTNLGGGLMGIMFDANDVLWATLHSYGSGLYTLDPTTGAGTLVFNSALPAPHGGDIYVAEAAEPASLALAGLAFAAGLAARVRLRREPLGLGTPGTGH